jgi:hypothetical protein
MSKYGWTKEENFITKYRFAELRSEHQVVRGNLARWRADMIVAAGGFSDAALGDDYNTYRWRAGPIAAGLGSSLAGRKAMFRTQKEIFLLDGRTTQRLYRIT